MIRAKLYVGLSGIVWLVEGFLFSRLLHFRAWQTGLMVVMYVGLFTLVVSVLLRSIPQPDVHDENAAVWRYVSLAPMLTVVVGSFVSLPLILCILVLGQL
jgi:hypothetical protein